MLVIEDGREYQLGNMQGSKSQEIVFFQRTARLLTNRELHEEKAGQSLPDYFFETLGIDADKDSDVRSTNASDVEENDGTTVNEVVKVLTEQIKSYQRTVPCDENEEILECLQRIEELFLERASNRRLNHTFATLKK